mgnify:FL=1
MHPEFGIKKEIMKDGYTVLTIDTKKAKWQGIAWRTLGDFGKRKFENFLILTRAKEKLKLVYV